MKELRALLVPKKLLRWKCKELEGNGIWGMEREEGNGVGREGEEVVPLHVELLGTPLGRGQFVVVCCDVRLSNSRRRKLRDAGLCESVHVYTTKLDTVRVARCSNPLTVNSVDVSRSLRLHARPT